MELLNFLEQKKLFTEEECKIIDRAFKPEEISKGAVILKENQFSSKMLFIESGLVRTHYVKDGKDITHFFFDENYFIAAVGSIFYGQSARYQWEVMEQSKLKTISYEDFLMLEERFPRLARVLLDFSIHMNHLFSQKLNLLQFQSAQDRYNLFLEMYPNLQNRVSLGDTASFLGVTQQTLSVIRGKKS